mmetsp:Transcript_8343/g.34949  ORF Transcript_8343/g.34949 Transcript_8343/m.34949 type:complete len:363 (+) Transcript_8343:28-1116(+)
MAAVLCACGKSKTFPLCDGSHVAENWTCVSRTKVADFAVTSSPRYETIARKLSSELSATLCLPGSQRGFPSEVGTLLVFTDSLDLAAVSDCYKKLRGRCKRAVVFSLGPGATLLPMHFANCSLWDLAELNVDVVEVFTVALSVATGAVDHVQLQKTGVRQIIAQVEAEPSAREMATRKATRLHPAFVSHAVRDEHLLQKPIHLLREWYDADLFLCADSIPPTANWYEQIENSLRQSTVFIGLVSDSLVQSKFCAFEMGAAMALQKPMYLISLDGTMPPAFVQHLQCVDVPRMQRLKPWLQVEDIVLEEMIKAMSTYCEKCEAAAAQLASRSTRNEQHGPVPVSSWLPVLGAFAAASALILLR